ncbi:hypothetical protein LUZ62_038535 [Rhynchospora pubera]|uniref:Uncharacterized protein n=1 Tax=Rhynchospora pubera TaxID=906938 RepID=A0AAV8F2M1_9POAL|nr:hypothetical protein LUZ62_038535 [Rhynchospora pubera]
MVSSSAKLLFFIIVISSAYSVQPWCPQSNPNFKFKQKTTRFWEFEEETKTWVEISLPYDLMSCINGTCTKVGSIQKMESMGNQPVRGEDPDEVPVRKRVSLNRMSESSVWITGQSGSIFERFWNGVHWVIAPHELPVFAGYAVSTYIVNQTILALSEDGILYQLQLNENSQPIWSEVFFESEESSTNNEEDDQAQAFLIKSGTVSYDGRKLFLSSINGSLIEVSEFQPLRWENHGRPPGGDVAGIADTGNIRPGVLFTMSSSGDLYEFDKGSKPSWKKHIWSDPSTEYVSLKSSTGCAIQGLFGAQSVSLFLLSKDGFLVERRLHRRKWKWTIHGAPENQRLSSLTAIYQNTESDVKVAPLLFATTNTGCVFEYQFPVRHSGGAQSNIEGTWINHMHPKDAKVAQSIVGVQLQAGRTMFPLDDGRLAELHLSGIGGDEAAPALIQNPITIRRKHVQNMYEWSILDVPETEGWNAEYCTEEHGPDNCIVGVKNDLVNPTGFGRRSTEEKQSDYIYTLSKDVGSSQDSYNVLSRSIELNFRMRVMHAERSLFLITESGMTFEYLFSDGVWLWLRHEYVASMKGALGSYNGSLYLVDVHGNLLIRERSGEELSWINCTGMKKGKQVASGSPWDGIPGKSRRVTIEDALFFVNKRGRLLQFTVALRAFKWKDCQNPPDTKIAFIVDQEVFRRNIVFVVGRNGYLYQYNRITELWHQHRQSPYLILSRSPGTAMRPYQQSLAGSIFMFSEDGALVEYHWTPQDGWEWVEHGTPNPGTSLVGAPGPCFDGVQLFVIGSDGLVYRRHLDMGSWRWTSHGYPSSEKLHPASKDGTEGHSCNIEEHPGGGYMTEGLYGNRFTGQCSEKIAAVRPIPFSEYSVIFELQDGRLAELRRPDEAGEWEWARIIGTPTSTCLSSYWTAVAS